MRADNYFGSAGEWFVSDSLGARIVPPSDRMESILAPLGAFNQGASRKFTGRLRHLMDKTGLNSVSVRLSVLQTHLIAAYPTREQRQREHGAGFTIFELLAVVAIVVTLTAIAVPYVKLYIHKAKVTAAVVEIRGLEKEIILFKTERGRYPGWPPDMLETLQEIGRDNFADPWGTPYQYRNLEDGPHTGSGKPKFCRRDRSYNPLNYDYDLYSVGPDQKVPTHNQITKNKGADDIVRAANGRYVGEGAKF